MDYTVIKLLGVVLANEPIVEVLREMANEAMLRANSLPEHLRTKSRWQSVIRVLRSAADELEAEAKAPRS